jgi:hypothetical protein
LRFKPNRWARALAGSVALLLALTFTAPPAFGAEVNTPTPPQAAPKSLAAAAEAKLASLDTSEAVTVAPAQAAATTVDQSGSFFKSPKGVAALVGIVAATALVFYKRSNDRDKVLSPVR